MRVIAGVARRNLLTAPTGTATRPTSDRAKESLFNIIASLVPNARFLDVFAGSGAIGIEALSRGAKEAVFVDNSPAAHAAIMQNLTKTKFANARIIKSGAELAIKTLAAESKQFDIIFLDPPYGTGLLAQTLTTIATAEILAENGVIIAEDESHTAHGEYRENNCIATHSLEAGLALTSTRTYGRTSFLFYTPVRG